MVTSRIELEPLERAAAALGRAGSENTPTRPEVVSHHLVEALRRAGTRHVYGDSADVEELQELLVTEGGGLPAGVDGNTANQPLVRKVAERYLDAGNPREWVRELSAHREKLLPRETYPLLYAVICGRLGNDMTLAFGADRGWEPSLQLHMDLCGRRAAAVRVGHLLREMTPNAVIKVPFTPDAPDCFLAARDLERAGIPVNFTSTFSARQAVAAALLADVTRTNIFMGRLNQGLHADRLGEHVDLEAQRALLDLRREAGVKTLLIVASIHEWETFERVAGCDVFTAPAKALDPVLNGSAIRPGDLESKLETSYEDRLGIPADVLEKAGADRIARLYRVEPEFVEFLTRYRESDEFARGDGDLLYKRFDEAGFGDFFHAPDREDRKEMEEGKLPRLGGRMSGRVALDTHYSLLANADFTSHQRAIDAEIEKRIA